MTYVSGRITIREGLGPGDIDGIVEMHGRVYADEHNFDGTFETYVATALNTFARASEERGKIWIAEDAEGRRMGSIAIVRTGERTAQLRWFILAPDARGKGVGRTLCDRAMSYVAEAAFDEVTLWTFEGLHAATRLYMDAGFTETRRKPGVLGGQAVTEIQMTWKPDG